MSMSPEELDRRRAAANPPKDPSWELLADGQEVPRDADHPAHQGPADEAERAFGGGIDEATGGGLGLGGEVIVVGAVGPGLALAEVPGDGL